LEYFGYYYEDYNYYQCLRCCPYDEINENDNNNNEIDENNICVDEFKNVLYYREDENSLNITCLNINETECPTDNITYAKKYLIKNKNECVYQCPEKDCEFSINENITEYEEYQCDYNGKYYIQYNLLYLDECDNLTIYNETTNTCNCNYPWYYDYYYYDDIKISKVNCEIRENCPQNFFYYVEYNKNCNNSCPHEASIIFNDI